MLGRCLFFLRKNREQHLGISMEELIFFSNIKVIYATELADIFEMSDHNLYVKGSWIIINKQWTGLGTMLSCLMKRDTPMNTILKSGVIVYAYI
jgi:hypothetical protein